MVAVRWYLRYGLSYRDMEELVPERGVVVDHVIVYRWVPRFTPLLIDAARPCRHTPGDRWFVDRDVRQSGRTLGLYRAIDQFGQVIDILVAEKRDLAVTRRFFTQTLEHGPCAAEVSTDRAPAYPRVRDELLPPACHVTEQYATNAVEADHDRLKSRLRPMRGLKRLRSARVISTGHAFIQNLRRGHYELALDLDPNHQLPAALTERSRHLNNTKAAVNGAHPSTNATAATWMADAGVSGTRPAEDRGHGSLTTTQRYRHPDATSIAVAGDSLTAFLSVRRSRDGPQLRAVPNPARSAANMKKTR